MDCQLSSVLLSLATGGLYVGSLYVWPQDKERDHPLTIKRRFASVVSAVLVVILLLHFTRASEERSVYQLVGLWGVEEVHIMKAILVPVSVTSLIFAGPLLLSLQRLRDHDWELEGHSLVYLRNYLVAPITEELIFRSALLALLVPCWYSNWASVAISSSVFGLAHSHHYLFQSRSGPSVPFASALCQTGYTFLFGSYSAAFYLRSGSVFTCFALHIFCNLMGFPDFETLRSSSFLWTTTMMGAVSWLLVLFYLAFS